MRGSRRRRKFAPPVRYSGTPLPTAPDAMLTHTTNLLFAAVVAGVFFQLLALVRLGGKLLRPRIANRLQRTRRTAAAPVAAPAIAGRVRRRPRRDYRLALRTARV